MKSSCPLCRSGLRSTPLEPGAMNEHVPECLFPLFAVLTDPHVKARNPGLVQEACQADLAGASWVSIELSALWSPARIEAPTCLVLGGRLRRSCASQSSKPLSVLSGGCDGAPSSMPRQGRLPIRAPTLRGREPCLTLRPSATLFLPLHSLPPSSRKAVYSTDGPRLSQPGRSLIMSVGQRFEHGR